MGVKLRTLNMQSGLSKVAGCQRKSPPTWLVSAGFSAWHFFMDDVFEIKYPWTGGLFWQLGHLLQNFLTTLCSTCTDHQICFYDHCNDKISFVNSNEIIYPQKFPRTVVWIQRITYFRFWEKISLAQKSLKLRWFGKLSKKSLSSLIWLATSRDFAAQSAALRLQNLLRLLRNLWSHLIGCSMA